MNLKKPQLFILHFSGGNCYSFNFLKPFLQTSIEVHPLELPGRGKRMNEKLYTTESEAIADYVRQISSLRNGQPFVVFGHSMGASLGLRVAKKLEDLADLPTKLIVAGNAGPGVGTKPRYRSTMSDQELKDELRTLGGMSEEVLNDADLFNFFSPIMRSDFRVLENSETLPVNYKLKIPITAIMGSSEETSNEIENWKRFTLGDFKHHIFPGNHFFIYDHPRDLAQIIANSYDRSLVF